MVLESKLVVTVEAPKVSIERIVELAEVVIVVVGRLTVALCVLEEALVMAGTPELPDPPELPNPPELPTAGGCTNNCLVTWVKPKDLGRPGPLPLLFAVTSQLMPLMPPMHYALLCPIT